MSFDETKFAAALADRDKAIIERLDGYEEKIGSRFDSLQDRIEEIESKRNSPGKVGLPAETRESREHLKLFNNWLRQPRDSRTKQALGDFQEKLSGKALSVGTSADGGFAVPEEISREIEKLEIKLSPVRNLVKVVRTSTGDFKQLVNIGGADAGWVGETDSRTETNTPQLPGRNLGADG
jgi:HK97 family phage major capsid protein